MKVLDTLRCFNTQIEAEGLTLAHLEPWTTWKLFKRFTQDDLEDAYETASFQFERFDEDPEDPYVAVFFVWQFTERDESAGNGGDDEFVGRLVVELQYAPNTRFLLPDTEAWAMDFPTPAEWATVVEGLPQFQEAMSHEPKATQVFFDQDE